MLAIVGSAVVLALRGLQLWRAIKSLRRSLTKAVAALAETAAATEAHAVAAAERTERLTAAAARLQESLARLGVLGAAANDLRRTVTGVRRAVPKK